MGILPRKLSDNLLAVAIMKGLEDFVMPTNVIIMKPRTFIPAKLSALQVLVIFQIY